MHASSTGFSPIESEVVKEFLRSCTVPLVCEVGDKLALMGTGTFFRLEGHLWLVTAAHVIPDEQSLRELAVPMRTAGQFLTLGNCILYRPNSLNLDVAIVLIQDTAFQQLVPQNWRVLGESNITRFNPAGSTYIIAGYPRETLGKKEMNWLDSFTQIYTNPYSGGADDADHSMLRLTYSRSASDHSGKLARTPNLEGMSGASVWAITNRPGELWAPDNVLKVVAVQVSFKHSDYIAAEWWTLVREVFRRWADEEAASV
jgi:hypothetical protein